MLTTANEPLTVNLALLIGIARIILLIRFILGIGATTSLNSGAASAAEASEGDVSSR